LPGAGSFVSWILLIFLILLILAAVAAGVLFLFARKCFHIIFDRPYPKPLYDRSPTEINQDTIYGRGQNWFYSNRLDFEDLSITSYDGIKLAAYYRPADNKDTKRLVILLHGWKDNPSVMAAFAQMYLEKADCHILIPHMRAHGMSQGSFIGYGLAESQDILMWTQYMEKHLEGPLSIIYHGWSMGAATALIAAGSRHLSSSVAGVAADSPYSSLGRQLQHYIRSRYHFAPNFLISAISWFARKHIGYSIPQVSPLAYAGRIKVPVLLIHGTGDTFVPPDMCEELYDKIRAPKKILFVQDVEHVMAYDAASSSYSSEVEQLLRACGYLPPTIR